MQRIYSYRGATLLQDMHYVYDGVGNVASIQDYWNLANGQPQTLTFAYDDAYRLTSAQAAGGLFGNYAQ